MANSSCIVVGIDYGTTYSGVAFARSGEPDRVHFVSNWSTPNFLESTKQKVPSAIYYADGNETPSWGYEATSEYSLRWLKLLLLDEKDMPLHLKHSKYIRRAKRLLEEEKKHVTEVIADYLRELWRHTLVAIKKTFGARLVALSTFKLVVTLPAIWQPYAQMRMEQAILMAGLLEKRAAGESTLSFLPEPEAAALACFAKMSNRPDIKKHDDFVVCDAGGGTVDIITYKIAKTSPVTVRESVPGDGKLCGAVRLDEAFESLLAQRLPRDLRKALSPAEMKRVLDNNWENGIKLDFTNSDKSYPVQIPFSMSLASIRCPKDITLKRYDIWPIFHHVLEEVSQLVLDQIRRAVTRYRKTPKCVLLVGGFGRSRVLFDYLKQQIKVAYSGVEVLQEEGADPWTAVCHGAVIKGLTKPQSLTSSQAKLVDSRFARHNIGTLVNIIPFDEEWHDEMDKEWCPVQRLYQAADQIEWLILKDEVIKDNEPKGFEFFQPLNEQPREIVNDLVYSPASDAPGRCDNSVKLLCTVRWSSVPSYKSLPIAKTDDGVEFRELRYEIKFVTHGVSQDFQVFHNGKMVAAKSVDVDFSDSGKLVRRE